MAKPRQYRVAHVGTGYTGSIALRQILRSPRLQLVGQLVHSPDKVGRDSGELVDERATGVIATDSLDDLLALDAMTFLSACAFAYASLRSRAAARRRALERIADASFGVALVLMTVVCAIIAWEIV